MAVLLDNKRAYFVEPEHIKSIAYHLLPISKVHSDSYIIKSNSIKSRCREKAMSGTLTEAQPRLKRA